MVIKRHSGVGQEPNGDIAVAVGTILECISTILNHLTGFSDTLDIAKGHLWPENVEKKTVGQKTAGWKIEGWKIQDWKIKDWKK